jgi:hypothetical protein
VKLTVTQLAKKFPIFYGTRRFITVFTRTHSIPRPCVTFRNKLSFYGEGLLAPRPTPNLEDRPLSAVHNILFNISAATLHIWTSYNTVHIISPFFLIGTFYCLTRSQVAERTHNGMCTEQHVHTTACAHSMKHNSMCTQ